MNKRNSISRGKLKAASQKERMHIWKEYFKNLLGKSPKVIDKPYMKIINNQLDIKLRLFIIIKGFRTIVFIFIVISKTFRPIYPPAFFRCLSNSGNFTELRTKSFIETTGVACSDSVSHNRVQVLSIPVLILAYSEDWTCNLQMISLLRSLGNQRL